MQVTTIFQSLRKTLRNIINKKLYKQIRLNLFFFVFVFYTLVNIHK